jgi:hypothetical protein
MTFPLLGSRSSIDTIITQIELSHFTGLVLDFRLHGTLNQASVIVGCIIWEQQQFE